MSAGRDAPRPRSSGGRANSGTDHRGRAQPSTRGTRASSAGRRERSPDAGKGRSANQQPGNSWRYLYERLTEKRFQQLCSALLAHVFPHVTCYPVGQSDGGRDATRKSGIESYVYQVKWSSKRVQDPVSWLTGAVEKERDNIARLVAAGATHYILLTSVAGTSKPERGTMDRLDKALAGHAAALGISMTCWWQADLDARVDSAPTELKWSYPDMLAGQDLIRYLRDADVLAEQDREFTTILRKVIAKQWTDDARVKFKQVELDSHDLSTLFIDVEAARVAAPGRARQILDGSSPELGGAARYLLGTATPFTLVRGEPGQGKSTLGQYVCQVHRAAFLKDSQLYGARRPELDAKTPRLPIRVDLRDYATWLGGVDPFDDEASGKRSRRPPNPAIELFLAQLLTSRSGGRQATAAAVQDMLGRYPMLVVLDGLDEVAQTSMRARVVSEINDFVARLGGGREVPQLVVTTRPNAAQLPEPSTEMFETIALKRLSPGLRTTYLRRWSAAQGLGGRDRRQLARTFAARSAEAHVSQLADNPMQLTILLYLMRRLGDSVPANRTALYSSYMETFLAREAAKSPQVQDNREDLEEVTAFLGWHLHSRAESGGTEARMSAKGIQGAINSYLFSVDKQTSHVADLFQAVTDRVWALTSKIDGYFEFDVQSVGEYFAARFLWEFAGADQSGFDPALVLQQLLRRPYWYNVNRFYAGFARPNEIAGMVDTVAEEFESMTRPSQVRLAAWELLADGVFRSRAKAEERAALLFADDLSVALLNHLFDAGAVTRLPPAVPAAALVGELCRRAAEDPRSPLNSERMRLAARVHPDRREFDEWWQPHMSAAAGTAEEVAWLRLGIAHHAGTRLPRATGNALAIADHDAARASLECGVVAAESSPLEQRLLDAVLGGACSDAEVSGTGLAADLLRLCPPHHFLAMAELNDRHPVAAVGHQKPRSAQNSQRRAVATRLKARDDRFTTLQAAMRSNNVGEAGTTSPWGNTARALTALFGPSWLAAEITIIGVCAPDTVFRTGGTMSGTHPLGEDADYGRLLQELRFNRGNAEWWERTHGAYPDALTRATWSLALVCAARTDVVRDALPLLVATVDDLPQPLLLALLASSSRLGVSSLRRPVPLDLVNAAAALSPFAGLLLAHHALDPNVLDRLPHHLDGADRLGGLGAAAWPCNHDLAAQLLRSPDDDTLAKLHGRQYESRIPIGQGMSALSDAQLHTVLRGAGSFPSAWIIAAERETSRRAAEVPLRELAEQAAWFG